MSVRTSIVLLSSLLLLSLAGCSGSGSTAAAIQAGCTQGGANSASQTLCLTSCNLGCASSGCSINQIAQNQPIILNFNQDIDPNSISSATISFRTASGEEPVGRYLVSGSTVQFVPEIRIVGAASFFGFKAAETYVMTLPGGSNQLNALRSTSGDSLASSYTCNLAVTRGVEDLNGQPPTADLISPKTLTNVDPRTTIAVEFSELVGAAPFLGSPQNAPIIIRVLKTKTVGGKVQCDPSFAPVQILGSWQVTNDPVRQITSVSFNPGQPIPSNVCVLIDVTNQIQDLSGKPLIPQSFQYVTKQVSVPPAALVESFDNDLNLDRAFSSGSWSGGLARPGTLGWDGLHGDFDPTDGQDLPGNVYQWDTDNMTIPLIRTLSGVNEKVTDGVFRFSRFVLPRGVTVRFVGSKPARIFVRGECRIDGTLDLAGGTMPIPDGNAPIGQTGGVGGAGAGGGGKGGNKGNNVAPSTSFDGLAGEDVVVPAGHAYAAQAVGTGGAGTKQFPATGKVTAFQWNGILNVEISAGGGGGGLAIAGTDGIAEETYNSSTNPQYLGPSGAGGIQFNLFPIPAGVKASDHLLVGGAGGGGSGSHPFFSSSASPAWHSGGGGGGGGGSLGLRVGADLLMATSGVISATGASTSDAARNFAVPGGGGSGGTVLAQVGGSAVMGGLIDVGGGTGGEISSTSSFIMRTHGGDGGYGYIQLETTATPTPALLGTTVPDPIGNPTVTSVRVRSLSEQDAVAGSRSVFRPLSLIFPPNFLRYEVEAIVDGARTTFSDDPAKGQLAAGSAAVKLLVQATPLDALGSINTGAALPWRQYVGDFGPAGTVSIDDDARTIGGMMNVTGVALRFLILFDRTNAASVQVDKVSIWYQAQ